MPHFYLKLRKWNIHGASSNVSRRWVVCVCRAIGVLNTGRKQVSRCSPHNVTHFFFRKEEQSAASPRGARDREHSRSPRGQTAITAQEIQSSTSPEAKCKIQQHCSRGVWSFLSPTSTPPLPQLLFNVFELLQDLIKDTCPTT